MAVLYLTSWVCRQGPNSSRRLGTRGSRRSAYMPQEQLELNGGYSRVPSRPCPKRMLGCSSSRWSSLEATSCEEPAPLHGWHGLAACSRARRGLCATGFVLTALGTWVEAAAGGGLDDPELPAGHRLSQGIRPRLPALPLWGVPPWTCVRRWRRGPLLRRHHSWGSVIRVPTLDDAPMGILVDRGLGGGGGAGGPGPAGPAAARHGHGASLGRATGFMLKGSPWHHAPRRDPRGPGIASGPSAVTLPAMSLAD